MCAAIEVMSFGWRIPTLIYRGTYTADGTKWKEPKETECKMENGAYSNISSHYKTAIKTEECHLFQYYSFSIYFVPNFKIFTLISY